jgi:hypothetical protein
MANIEAYRACVQQVITEYARYTASADDLVETQTIFDTTHDHYQLTHAGWRRQRRIYGCVLHVDVKDGKIWIQYDGTEVGIANKLVDHGIPKDDIVLAFLAPSRRQFSEFAVE